ncbi:MAG: hypothetical protein Q8O00_01765 [Holophaga sp.]|nr:hypothetical protein [Holophaga sp.]
MQTALELTLIVVLITFTIGIMALLAQLRRTAKGVDAFLLSIRKDHPRFADVVGSSLRSRTTSARDRHHSGAPYPEMENRRASHST